MQGIRHLGHDSSYVHSGRYCMESDIHIFGMNDHYKNLLNFLQQNASKFIIGASIPFTEVEVMRVISCRTL